MKTNLAGIELIKAYEGLRTTAYVDPVGKLTIGYGTTNDAGVGTITKGMKITPQRAVEMLVASLPKYEAGVLRALKRVPNENQFSAMVSFAYNIGETAFAGSSVARLFNAGNVAGAADAFRLWNKGTIDGKKVVLPGLVTRREAERKLFLAASSADVGIEPAKPETPPVTQNGAGKGIAAAVMAIAAAVAAAVAYFWEKLT